ncbi:MAG: universal stress protein [Pseudomonadota bacterium]
MQQIVIDIADPTSKDQPALDAALACRSPESTLALFHNVYHKSIMDDPGNQDQVLDEVRDLLLESRHGQLEALASDRLGQKVAIHLVWAEQGWQELIRYSAQSNASLVVTQTVHKNRWQRLTLSNEDWETIRHCPIPLLLARSDTADRYQQVIAAIDPLHLDDKPASLDQKILHHASGLAKLHSAPLKVVNVVVPTQLAPMGGMESAMAVCEVSEQVLDAHKDATSRLMEAEKCSRGADSHVVVGNPEEEIVELANATSGSLVVMGGVSRTRLQRLLIGSTAERVLDKLTGDVLIVKPADFGVDMPAVDALMQASVSPMTRSFIG